MNRCAWAGKVTEHRKPWGREFSWSGIFRGKEIHINEGCRTSLKFNRHKNEILYVQSGKIYVEFADEGHLTSPHKFPSKNTTLTKGGLLNVQAGCPYRLSALEDSVVFEISDGHFPDDRVILEDDYGRDSSEAEANNWIFNPSKQ